MSPAFGIEPTMVRVRTADIIADPAKYDGKGSDYWSRFQRAVRMELNIRHDLYNTGKLRVAYIDSLLIGNTFDCAYTKHTLDGAPNYSTEEELLSFLAQMSGDPYRNAVA